MNHRQFLSSLSESQRQTLTAKSDRAGLVRLSQQWGVILLLAELIMLRIPYWPPLILPLGILLVFQFTLLHETVHRTPFASRWLNDAVAYGCGFLLFLPMMWFRYFHLEHHRHTHTPGLDPELATPKPTTRVQYVLYVLGFAYWRSLFKTLWQNALGQCDARYVPKNKRPQIQREAQYMLVGYTVLAGLSVLMASVELFMVWIIPLWAGQPFLRLYLLAEHTGCPHSDDMLANTRTTYTHPLVYWLAWNMPYHAEHHTFPAVPFFRLPELHVLLREHLQVTERGYGRFHRGIWGLLS